MGGVPAERMTIEKPAAASDWPGRSPDIEHGPDMPQITLRTEPAPPPPPLPPPPPPPATYRPPRQASTAIYEVPHRLRKVKERAYEPNVISIGPYHHGKNHLKAMEVIKRRCFDRILEVTNLEYGEFVKAMEALENRVRKCYRGPIDHCDRFKEMMVYDGCFIVMLINNIYPEDLLELGHVQTDMWYDLLLPENQLPFFVLLKLDSMIMRKGEGDLEGDRVRFARSALSLFQNRLPCSVNGSYTPPAKDVKHLLDLVHKCCRPSTQGIQQHQQFKQVAQKSDRAMKLTYSATKLEDAGFDFLYAQGAESLFDITFIKDTQVLSIPTLQVDHNTERLLLNFMAYEQFTQTGEPTYVSDYLVFMDNLINTGKDVEVLYKSKIIDNRFGDHESVAQMFNKLGGYVRFSDDFYYAETFVEVNKFCKRKWNKKWAKRKWKKYNSVLMKDYFNSPWSFCSFLAAVVLLLLTLLQTIYTLLSYYHHK